VSSNPPCLNSHSFVKFLRQEGAAQWSQLSEWPGKEGVVEYYQVISLQKDCGEEGRHIPD
jgi:hypothetical protein